MSAKLFPVINVYLNYLIFRKFTPFIQWDYDIIFWLTHSQYLLYQISLTNVSILFIMTIIVIIIVNLTIAKVNLLSNLIHIAFYPVFWNIFITFKNPNYFDLYIYL